MLGIYHVVEISQMEDLLVNPISTFFIAATILLAGCSSSNDDPVSGTGPDDGTPGIAEGEPNPSGEISEPAPDDDPLPWSNVPGGDTTAVAGYWGGTTSDGERYFVITPNGLWTEYFLTYDGNMPGNCFWMAEPLTLTPENSAANGYSLANGQVLTLTTDASRTALTVEYVIEERAAEVWPAVVGQVPEDLPLCQ